MEKLLTYENGKLLLEGYDLAELANMYQLSVKDFFLLFELHLALNQEHLIGANQINNFETKIYLPGDIQYSKTQELLVSEDGYESMKKRVFDFAYTNCSRIGDTKFKYMGMEEAEGCGEFNDRVKNFGEYYSCIYSSAWLGWNQKMSEVPINREEQAERFALIRKGN